MGNPPRLAAAANPCLVDYVKSKGSDLLPTDAILSDLAVMRRTVHVLLDAQRRRMDAGFDEIEGRVAKLAKSKKFPEGRSRDTRDMLTLLRGSKVNPAKSKRKDLKKLEGVLGDLQMLTEDWG
jgi:hypothetical protein